MFRWRPGPYPTWIYRMDRMDRICLTSLASSPTVGFAAPAWRCAPVGPSARGCRSYGEWSEPSSHALPVCFRDYSTQTRAWQPRRRRDLRRAGTIPIRRCHRCTQMGCGMERLASSHLRFAAPDRPNCPCLERARLRNLPLICAHLCHPRIRNPGPHL